MRIASLLLAAAIAGLVPVIAHAEDTPASTSKTFSADEKAAIQNIIKDYLTKEHPEVLMEAAQELQKRDQVTAEVKSQEAIDKDKDKIFGDSNTPVGGNPKGDVTIVEFFDYQCGYCKMSEESLEKLVKEDGKIKFIYKEYPILGLESMTAAKAAIASIRQGKYIEFHNALMKLKDHLNDTLLYDTAKSVGLDVDKLKKDMNDPAVAKIAEDSLKLGNDIGVRGTPMFIINNQSFPGAMQYDQFKKAVEEARANAAKKS